MPDNDSQSSEAPHYFHTARAVQLWITSLDDAPFSAKTLYYDNTFTIMLEVQKRDGYHIYLPTVLAVDESCRSIKDSIRRLLPIEGEISLEVELEGSGLHLVMAEEDTFASLGLLQQKDGVDNLVANEAVIG